MMKHLKNLKRYTPEEPALGMAVAYLCDDDGNDWYEQQKGFSANTVKIAYDSEGIIWAVSRDVSMLWPVNLSVAELTARNTPSDLSDAGEWVFDGKKITRRAYTQAECVAQAEAKKKNLLTDANSKTQAWQTQLMLGMISDDDKESLIKWMSYVQKVQSIDTSGAPNITWPALPA
ncbi:tail fiber assembly protein [Serratia marcescens]|nr:tail fiber assembly protein [Serratia marcescens]